MITTESITNFISSLNQNSSLITSKTNNGVKTLLFETIKTYFSSLSQANFETIGLNIISKFFENKYRANASTLHSLIKVYKKIIIRKPFQNWSSLSQLNIVSNSNDSSHINYSYPKPNYLNQLRNNNQISTISRRTNSLTQMENFLQRQEEYKKSKSQRKEKRLKDSEDEYNMMCTFTPNISYSKSITSDGNKSAYVRLYEDSNKRKVNYDKKVNDYIKQIKKASNCHNRGKKSIDKFKIEKLYNDYKVQKSKRKMLMEQIDYETGATFKPRVNTSPYYSKRINGTINDRSKKSLQNKQNFVTTFNYLREKELIENQYKRLNNKNTSKNKHY